MPRRRPFYDELRSLCRKGTSGWEITVCLGCGSLGFSCWQAIRYPLDPNERSRSILLRQYEGYGGRDPHYWQTIVDSVREMLSEFPFDAFYFI